MSLAEALRARQRSLRRATTRVTRTDGTSYLETRHSSERVPLPVQLGFVADTTPDAEPARVTSTLFVGSQDCCVPDALARHDIGTVVSVGVPPPCALPPDVVHAFVPCLDVPETELVSVLRRCFPELEKASARPHATLVHCNAGVSRSVAVVVAWLMRELRLPYDEALAHVRAARPCAQPNVGFVRQLRSLDPHHL